MSVSQEPSHDNISREIRHACFTTTTCVLSKEYTHKTVLYDSTATAVKGSTTVTKTLREKTTFFTRTELDPLSSKILYHDSVQVIVSRFTFLH